MQFIPPMLATRLEDPTTIDVRRYRAEPKLDGQRAQIHVSQRRTVHVYSRPGRELVQLAGLAWLRDLRWPFAAAILDGEVVAGDGTEGVMAVFEARSHAGSAMAFTAFDVLDVRGRAVIAEPWTERRKRLEDLLAAPLPGVCVVPSTEDAPALWHAWVGQGGEGIVLKDPASLYQPGLRTSAWLKLKPKLIIDAVVTGGSDKRITWGDWGHAVALTFRYVHPRTGAEVEAKQAVRLGRAHEFTFDLGAHVRIVCWGVMPSGLLRHPVLAT